MQHRPGPRVDQIGINLLRIVTGTFFMAVALNLVHGLDPAALFRPVLDTSVADAAGAITLVSLALWFTLGAALRLAALSLALFVLTSSFTANFITAPVEDLSAFWYDLTLCCGVLLSYLTLDERRLRRASVFSHQARERRIAQHRQVKPRRVTQNATVKTSTRARPAPEVETNIFADVAG